MSTSYWHEIKNRCNRFKQNLSYPFRTCSVLSEQTAQAGRSHLGNPGLRDPNPNFSSPKELNIVEGQVVLSPIWFFWGITGSLLINWTLRYLLSPKLNSAPWSVLHEAAKLPPDQVIKLWPPSWPGQHLSTKKPRPEVAHQTFLNFCQDLPMGY